MENKSLFTVATNLPGYIKNLKEKIKNEILRISFETDNNYVKKYDKDIDVYPNKKFGKIFINFKDKYIIKKFCENIRIYDNKINIDDFELQLYPDHNTFTSIKIKDKSIQTNDDILYNYIKNLEYIKYCCFVENIYIYFSFKEDAERFISKKHILDNIILDIEIVKIYKEISENFEINYEDKNDINIDNKIELYNKENKYQVEKSNVDNVELVVDELKYDEIILNNENNLNELSIDIFKKENDNNLIFSKEDNNTKENINKNKIEMEKSINSLQEKIEEYIKEIKKNIDKEFIGDKQKYGINMKLELNKIISEMSLFRNNYQDFIEYIE